MGLILNAGFQYLISRYDSYKDFQGKKCLMLGKQSVGFTYGDFIDYCGRMGFELNLEHIGKISNKKRRLIIDSFDLFYMMGFDKVSAMDVSDYEGADLICDLNEPIPSELRGQFYVVFDGGTLEHVFDLRTCLSNISALLEENGIVIHDVPAANWCNHGFYSFSPTILLDYYTANKFKINSCYVYVYSNNGSNVQYQTPDCRISDPQTFLTNKLDMSNEKALLVCISTKNKNSTLDNVPMQSMYVSIHKQDDEIQYMIKYLQKKEYCSIALYGTGEVMRSIARHIELVEPKIKIVGLLDKDDNKIGSEMMGYRVCDIDEIQGKVDCIVIASFQYANIIEQRLYGIESLQNIEIINISSLEI